MNLVFVIEFVDNVDKCKRIAIYLKFRNTLLLFSLLSAVV